MNLIINSKIIKHDLIDYRLDIVAVDKSAVADPGEGPGGPAPPPPPSPLPPLLFLSETEARRAEKKIFGDRPPYLKVWNRHWSEQSVKGVTT